MKVSKALSIVAVISTAHRSAAFAPTALAKRAVPASKPTIFTPILAAANIRSIDNRTHRAILQLSKKTSVDDKSETSVDGGWQLNPPYAVAWVGFLAYGLVRTLSEPDGASQDVLNQFLADPIHPGVNELFAVVFNLLGLAPIAMACLVMPSAGATVQKLPAAPFLAASAGAGYGALGPYMSFRRPATSVSRSELGWFTANVLENKAFNWLVLGSALSTLFVTGCASALLSDPAGTAEGYADLFASTAIASASSVDLAILSVTAASLIPEDLERRGIRDVEKANAIAASTLLLPMIGAVIYCALRPSLPED